MNILEIKLQELNQEIKYWHDRSIKHNFVFPEDRDKIKDLMSILIDEIMNVDELMLFGVTDINDELVIKEVKSINFALDKSYYYRETLATYI